MRRTKFNINEESVIAARGQLASLMGTSFDGKRDLYEAFGYTKKELTFIDFFQRYKRQDIAKAVISRPARDTWSGDIVVLETHDDKQTEFEKEFDKLQKRLKLKSKFTRLDKITSLGKYGVLLLGLSDCRIREDFAKEPNQDNLDLLYVKPVSEANALIHKYDNDPRSERYGLPEYYDISLKGINGQNSKSTLKVHYSRVIHVAWDLFEDDVEGTPVLEAIFNRLMDLEKLVGGSAEMFWRGARPGLAGQINPDFEAPDDLDKKAKEHMDEYIHDLRRFLLMQGVEVKELSPEISDPSNHVKTQVQMISAETGIPQRILLGAEQGELASGQDADAWKTLIQNRRQEQAEQIILRPFIDRLIELGVLPKPQTEDYSIMWSDLFAPSEKERAETGKTRAAAIQQYLQNPMATEVVPPKVFLKYLLGFDKQQLEYAEELTNEDRLEEERFNMQNPEQNQNPQNQNPQNQNP